MSKRFAGMRRSGFAASRPSRVWADVSAQFTLTAVAATTAVALVQLQAPANLSNLTSDPPEDLTLLRMRGTWLTSLSVGVAVNWTLALMVQDTAWTPSATFTADADKRVLWACTYEGAFTAGAAAVHTWHPPGHLEVAGVALLQAPRESVSLDIAPRVKIEAGKALHLIAYENSGAATLSVASTEMRVLFQRSGRR